MADRKLYEVTGIEFSDSVIEAKETGLNIFDVPEEEVFDILDFRDFKIRLDNRRELAEIVDFREYVENRKCLP